MVSMGDPTLEIKIKYKVYKVTFPMIAKQNAIENRWP